MPNRQNIDRPLVMLGAGRSGTSWLMDMMFRHSDVEVVVDNTLLGVIYKEAFNSWWTPAFRRVHCEDSPGRQDELVINAIRAAICEMFPSQKKFWVTKAIWDGTKPSFGGVPNEFRKAIFPNARYVHFCRSPLTCIPSILEYFADRGQLDTIEKCEEAYCSSHRDALRMRDLGVPFLAVRQEDIRENPREVWDTICRFAGVRSFTLDPAVLGGEVNASESMRGKVHRGRAPLEWSSLSAETHAIAREIGYEVPADAVPASTGSVAEQSSAPRENQSTIERLASEKNFLLDELRKAGGNPSEAKFPEPESPAGLGARLRDFLFSRNRR